tara:strand:+ start:2439 stop:2621 length:183 start_codon:yes stop_codon:yes gene_type:complete
MKKPLAYYNLDDLFKDGDLIYDKEGNFVFKYDIKKHKATIKENPNNFRVAHKGDILNPEK